MLETILLTFACVLLGDICYALKILNHNIVEIGRLLEEEND